jgi:hypothetical protein
VFFIQLQEPAKTSFQRLNDETIHEFHHHSNSPMQEVQYVSSLIFLKHAVLIVHSMIVNSLLHSVFPGIAKRYERCKAYMKKTYNLEPGYGLFWNFCVNSPCKLFKRIHCKPHVDAKNLALGICVLYIWGKPSNRSILCKLTMGVRQIQPLGKILACNLGGRYHYRTASRCVSSLPLCDLLSL